MPTIQEPPETITHQLLRALSDMEPTAITQLAIACHDRHRLTLDYDPDMTDVGDAYADTAMPWFCSINDIEGHGATAYEAARRAVEAFLAYAPADPETAGTMPESPKSTTTHQPVLGNASAHGLAPGDESLAALQPGDCVAVLTPEHPPHQIVVRVVEFSTHRIIGGPLVPETLVGVIEPDQAFGPLFRPHDPAFSPGARIRFHRANISAVY